MITAILEILGLLTVSCAIGVYFTYRYWKSKSNNPEVEAAPSNTDNLDARIASLEAENGKLKDELAKSKKTSAKKAETKAADNTEEIARLREEMELKDQELAEKERELEELSRELEKKKISYYKQIDGKRYKAITLKMADESIEGKGDGRISKEDAAKIFATISDGKSYTQVEKDTMRYIRGHYNWTEGADELFRKKVRSWAAKGHELN